MVCSRYRGHQLPELELGNSPSFLAAFLGGTPPFGWPLRILSGDRANGVIQLFGMLVRVSRKWKISLLAAFHGPFWVWYKPPTGASQSRAS